LGEVLVGRELEPDAPLAADRCGTCSACLDACPTGALVAPRTLDASRCISYLTIEHRGTIPEEARPMLHDWVFGCDICQEVCPWNQRFARPTEEPAFDPIRPTLDLAQLLTLDEHAFRARFRHTPLRRSRRAGLLRNAAVALGNLGGQSAPSPEADTWTRALERSLSDPEPLVAEHAAWALKQMRR
jgi:epoxyqueuosine reductase